MADKTSSTLQQSDVRLHVRARGGDGCSEELFNCPLKHDYAVFLPNVDMITAVNKR